MNILVDTNILGRLAQPGHAHYQPANDAVDAIRRRGDVPCVIPQVLYEFWVVATRPVAQNGLGMTAAQADRDLTQIESLFTLLDENPNLYADWRRLIVAHQVVGKNAHDARIVATMAHHAISQVLTFNKSDFAKYSGITVLDPVSFALTKTQP